MKVQEIRDAIKLNNIDDVIQGVNELSKEEALQVADEIKAYYSHELVVAQNIQDILATVRIQRMRDKIPAVGNYTLKLE